jgi:hypothetical protein
MLQRSLILSAFVLVSGGALYACTEASVADTSNGAATVADGGSSGSSGSSGGTGGSLEWPVPGSRDNAVTIDPIVQAFKQTKHEFYDTQNGYTSLDPSDAGFRSVPDKSEPASCLSACPAYWGDLVCHYYCEFPSYSSVIPNIRGCYSQVARGQVIRQDLTPPRAMFSPEVYDYCVFQDSDYILNRFPAYNQATIDANKASGTTPGVLAWVEKNQADVFKYVMYTGYSPFIFKFEDQQKAVNAFYDINLTKIDYTAADAADVAECKANRPVRPTDPQDGTHCSSAKSQAIFVNHPNFAAYVAFMNHLMGITPPSSGGDAGDPDASH